MLESQFSLAQEVIRSVRDARARSGRKPREELSLRLRADREVCESLVALEGMMSHLAVLRDLEVSPNATRTKDSAVIVLGEIELYLPGLVDLEKERVRLEDQLQKTEKRLVGCRKKLANENFISRAAADVVERERQLEQDLISQIETIRANLDQLNF